VDIVGDWAEFLAEYEDEDAEERDVSRRLSTGRPWGNRAFIRRLSARQAAASSPAWAAGRKGAPGVDLDIHQRTN